MPRKKVDNRFRAAKISGAGITAFIIGMVAGDILPKPTDVIHLFVVLPWLNTHTGDPWYWTVALIDMYVLSFLWLFPLAVIALYWRTDNYRRVAFVGAAITIGAIIGILARIAAGG